MAQRAQTRTYLHALSVAGASLVDVLARLVAAHEADGADAGRVAQEVHRVHAAVHDLRSGSGNGGKSKTGPE
jgi:hypothetical protein